jgi:hypothetical protein
MRVETLINPLITGYESWRDNPVVSSAKAPRVKDFTDVIATVNG